MIDAIGKKIKTASGENGETKYRLSGRVLFSMSILLCFDFRCR